MRDKRGVSGEQTGFHHLPGDHFLLGLSKHLQSPEILRTAAGMDQDTLRSYTIDTCRRWYEDHPQERELIKANLKHFAIKVSDTLLNEIEHNIFLHYYEKFLPHIKSPQEYAAFLQNHVDCRKAVALLHETLAAEKGILLLTAHFGGIEFLIPSLSLNKLPFHTAVRFTTEQFSAQMRTHAQEMENSGFFGHVDIIEIGKPGTRVALDMYAVLRNRNILFSVFDERTAYSIPVTLFGKKVWGGAGLDRLLRAVKEPIALFTTYMIRESLDAYRLELVAIDPDSENPIQSMYTSLELIVERYCAQWYFLHEEIPFVNEHDG